MTMETVAVDSLGDAGDGVAPPVTVTMDGLPAPDGVESPGLVKVTTTGDDAPLGVKVRVTGIGPDPPLDPGEPPDGDALEG